QRGVDEPLRVFDGDFVIGIALTVAPTVAPGTVQLPAVLRYQACDEVACYLPAKAPVSWALTVAAGAGQKQHDDLFKKIAFGTGEPPRIAAPAAASVPVLTPAPTSSGQAAKSADDLAALDGFVVKGTTVG